MGDDKGVAGCTGFDDLPSEDIGVDDREVMVRGEELRDCGFTGCYAACEADDCNQRESEAIPVPSMRTAG